MQYAISGCCMTLVSIRLQLNNAGSVGIDYLFSAQERFRRILNLAYSVVVILPHEGEEIRMQT